MDETTVFQLVGGTPFFVELVERFYARVAVDPVLRPLYPDDDLTAAREHLTAFLVQYWGGPTTYSDERATRGCACATPASRSRRRSVTPGIRRWLPQCSKSSST